MIYEHMCPSCEGIQEVERSVEDRNDPLYCFCTQEGVLTQRVILTIPQIVTSPYHLRESNRFPGSKTDHLELARKYEKNRETGNDKAVSHAREEAETRGGKVVSLPAEKSLAQMVERG